MVKKRFVQFSLQALLAFILLVPAPGAWSAPASSLDSPDQAIPDQRTRLAPPLAPDAGSFIFAPIPSIPTTEAGGTTTFTVALDTLPAADVIVSVSSLNTAEGTVPAGPLTFTSQDWNQPQSITVSGVDDAIDDGNVSYTIRLTAASADPEYDTITGNYLLTNTDDDTAGISVNPTSGLVTDEAGTLNPQFTVNLTSQPLAVVTVSFASSDPSEGAPNPGSYNFDSSNWNIPQTVTVSGVDDDIDDGNIAYTILIGPASSSDPNYNGLTHPGVSVTNQDDDTAGLTISHNGNLETTENGGKATFRVRLNSRPTGNVRLNINSLDQSEGTVDKNTLTFTAGNWDLDQTVTVTGVPDSVKDGDIPYQVEISINKGQTTAGEYQNVSSRTVQITNLDAYDGPQANLDSYTTNEDTPLTVPAPGVLANDTQPASSAILVSDALNGVVSLQSDGGFTYTPDKDYFGPDSFTYRFSDGVNTSAAGTVSITVNPVNDAPLAAGDLYYGKSLTTTLSIAAPGVLKNDSDVEGDNLIASLGSGPASGTLNLNPNGSFTYTPTASTDGEFTFTYRADDQKGGKSEPATVRIVIDTQEPSLSWVNPIGSGGVYIPKPNQRSVGLSVEAEDDAEQPVLDVQFVQFWILLNDQEYIYLDTVYQRPFQIEVDMTQFFGGWNRVVAFAYDQAMNRSDAYGELDPANIGYIWVYNPFPYEVNLPLIRR